MVRIDTILLVSLVILAGCTTPSSSQAATDFETPISNRVEVHDESEADGHDHVHLDPEQATAEMGVALVSSELTVGPNRFAVGLFDATGNMVQDAKVHLHYYDLSNPEAPLVEEHGEATRLQSEDGLVTIFAQERDFTKAGEWGVEVQAQFPDGATAIKRIGFEVLADSPTVKPGEQAPRVDTPTASEVENDLSRLTSAQAPNPALYDLSLADALTNGKPTVLLLATPAFCQTRFCGPAYEITSELQQRYGDGANFVHVEVYTGLPNPAANNWEVAPAMTAFGLSTEPWLYLIDNTGAVTYRVESMFTGEEVERHLQELLN